jgi:UMF1 family MFS transporter
MSENRAVEPPPRSPGPWPPASARVAWILFDCATQPFFTLVTTFVFAPYFASVLASDPAEGQALWGYATGAAGLVIALGSPVLGAIADVSGPRKLWIAAFGALLALGCAVLWFAAPGAPHAIAIALLGFAMATIGAEFATVFNNAMMPSLAPPERLGRLSGTGWAVGYVGGLVSLALTLAFLAASPETGRTLAGLPPAFGLDARAHEGERLVGPLTALWFILFVLPMFLLTPDRPRGGVPLAEAARMGVAGLRTMVAEASRQPGLLRFLIANMVYTDGLVALFALGGIYAAGTFGWGTTEIGIFGILIIVTGTLGAFLGGRLDEAFGPKRVIVWGLAGLLIASLGILGTTRDTILYVIPVAANSGGGLFAGAAEKAYVALGLLIGLVAGPVQAASRTLLLRLSRPEDAGRSFGFFALSGKVTSFVGPTLAAVATSLTGSQRAGVAVVAVFFALGLALLAPVSAGSGGTR